MSVIILLLLISLVLAGGFLIAFFWSVEDGQFDDAYGPARRILYQDEGKKEEKSKQDITVSQENTNQNSSC